MKMKTESIHYREERQQRETLIRTQVSIGKTIQTVLWDRGHKHGPELHHVTNTGVIIIENAYSHRIVTKYVARPGQIERLYDMAGAIAPRWLIQKAIEHQRRGYNLI